MRSTPGQGRHYVEVWFLEYSFRSFPPKLSSDDWLPCAVKGRGPLLGKVSCYITQRGCNTRTLGSMKTASWFWVGQPGSSSAQRSFAAARQTLRHVGASDLVWLFVFLNCCLDIICEMTCHVTHR